MRRRARVIDGIRGLRTTTRGTICLAVCAIVSGQSAVAQQDRRFDGEFGLYVGVTETGLEVRWITTEAGQGVVHVVVDGDAVELVQTPVGQAHVAYIQNLAPDITLLYGAEGGPLHRTRVLREPRAEPVIELEGVETVYMFGDVHGQYDRVVALLGNAGLVDDDLGWTGGDAHLVLLGDIFDRGDDVTGVLWLLYRLEREAAAAGGAVHVVLGNHEAMVMSGDLRYLSGKEALIANAHGLGYGRLFDPHVSVLGRWLARKPALVKMDDLLLAHGGVSPEYVDYTLQQYQDSLRTFIDEELFVHWNDQEYLDTYADRVAEAGPDTPAVDSAGIARRYEFFFGAESVMWFRDLVRSDTLDAHLDRVLESFDVGVHVVGHTPVKTIREGYDGRLIATDLEEAATEMLHMVRRPDGTWDRYRIPLFGEPSRLSEIHTEEGAPDTIPGEAGGTRASGAPDRAGGG
ncbi:MAG: metallophosphoesterase [Gemmatimonadota bacterium]|nr:metallophosphoesterase [Gemmatimonadota bacterium]